MHKKGALFLLISLVIVIIISILWKEDKPDTASIPIENTTEFITNEDGTDQETSRFKLEKKQTKTPVSIAKEEIQDQETDKSIPKRETATFRLINTNEAQSHQITLSDQKMTLLQNEKPIVMVNLFATWCPPCMGQIAYLNDLHKKYQKELFIAGVLTHDDIDTPSLETLMAKQQINYFISHAKDNNDFSAFLAQTLDLDENFSIPLTVIYVNGDYFTHYEGTVPVEMIEYDIQQAKKQLNSR